MEILELQKLFGFQAFQIIVNLAITFILHCLLTKFAASLIG